MRYERMERVIKVATFFVWLPLAASTNSIGAALAMILPATAIAAIAVCVVWNCLEKGEK